MKIDDEQFKSILAKAKVHSVKKVISDAEFKSLLSKTKTFKVNEAKETIFKEVSKVKKIKKSSTVPLYRKIVDLYEKMIESPKQTIVREVRIEEKKDEAVIQRVKELEKILEQIIKKVTVYEGYLGNGQGGPGIIMHDSSLSGTGVPGDPLSVAGGGSGVNVETPSGAINGSNVTFIVTHTPKFVVLNQQTLFQNDGYTLSGLTIIMLVVPVSGSTLRSIY